MKKISLLAVIVPALLLFHCRHRDEYDPNLYFSKSFQDSIVKQSVRYSARLPPHATHETKFSQEFDWYYKAVAAQYDVRRCAPAPNDSGYYFLMTRKARSIWPAREAIGGKLTVDTNMRLVSYEEIFRTWKMAEDSLNARAFELFDRMVQGKDLESYRPKYKGDRYIEFPDDRYYFDRSKTMWRDRLADSLGLGR